MAKKKVIKSTAKKKTQTSSTSTSVAKSTIKAFGNLRNSSSNASQMRLVYGYAPGVDLESAIDDAVSKIDGRRILFTVRNAQVLAESGYAGVRKTTGVVLEY